MSESDMNLAIAQAEGWTKCRLAIKGAGGGFRVPTAHGIPPKRAYEAPCPDYTRNLNASVNLCDTLIQEGWHCSIIKLSGASSWSVQITKLDIGHTVDRRTLALAICEAFLRAKNLWA